MALNPITPFSEETYLKRIPEFPEFIVQTVERTMFAGGRGWFPLFTSYKWQTHDQDEGGWRDGLRTRFRYHEELTRELERPATESTLLYVANDILDWGKHSGGTTKHFELDHQEALRDGCRLLAREEQWSKVVDSEPLFMSNVIACSKVYACFDPWSWVWYDTRVVTALGVLATAFLGAEKLGKDTKIRFPWPVPRSKKLYHPPALPKASPVGQRRRAFLYASWLLRHVAELMSPEHQQVQPPPRVYLDEHTHTDESWQVYHVEMALMMLGQDPPRSLRG